MSSYNYPYNYSSGASYNYATSGDDEYDSVPAVYHSTYPASYSAPQPTQSVQPSHVYGSAPYSSASHSHYPASTSHAAYYSQYPQSSYPSSTASSSSYYPSHTSTSYHSSYLQPPSAYADTMGDSVLSTTESMSYHSTPARSGSRSLSVRRSKSPGSGRTWTCDVPDCTSTAQFTRLADLTRHKETVHFDEDNKPFPCTVPRCRRVGSLGFTRRDHLTEHMRSYHHLNIRKRGPGERSAAPL